MGKQKKALYYGWVGYNNLGDEAILVAHKKLFPELEFEIYVKDKISETIPDIVFLGGGTLINRAKHFIPIAEKLMFQGVPAVSIGTGLAFPVEGDPIDDWDRSINEWVRFLQKFSFVGVRGPESYNELIKRGLKKVEVVGDTALVLKEGITNPKNRVIGINIGQSRNNSYGKSDRKTIGILSKFISHCVKNGNKVIIFVLWEEDYKYAKEVADKFNDDIRLFCEYNNIERYIAEIAKCEFFIGYKLHSGIFSTMQGIPTILIEYQNKCLDYMESIGQEKYVIRTDSLNLDELINKFNQLNKDKEEVVKMIVTRTTNYYDKLYSVRNTILKLIEN